MRTFPMRSPLFIMTATLLTAATLPASADKAFINSDLRYKKAYQAWEPQTHVFGCNETQFNPKNILRNFKKGTVGLMINASPSGDRQFSGGELKYVGQKNTPNLKPQTNFLYGRYSASIKTSRFPGTVSSLFLYRSNPWQEIDIEFVGSNPRKIQFNVYFNKGKEGDPNNDWQQDSPVQMDLPFDSSEAFHEYTIEWGPGLIRWFVDGKLYREITDPNQVPYLGMTLRMNHWGVCDSAADWAGAHFAKDRLTKGETPTVEYKWIRVWGSK